MVWYPECQTHFVDRPVYAITEYLLVVLQGTYASFASRQVLTELNMLMSLNAFLVRATFNAP